MFVNFELPNTRIDQIPNAELYPAFLLMPESFFDNYPEFIPSIPRYPRMLMINPIARDNIASDYFLQLMIDGYAYATWPVIAKIYGLAPNMEVYSADDPAWIAAHQVHMWRRKMERMNIVPSVTDLIQTCQPNAFFNYMKEDDFNSLMERVVPAALVHFNFDWAIKIAIENRCWEDFDARLSNAKTDFYRKWNHSRTKFYENIISETSSSIVRSGLGIKTGEPEDDPTLEGLLVDETIKSFLMELEEKDLQLLRLHYHGYKQEKIAEIMGYASHSAVSKRMKKLVAQFEEFSGMTINKKKRKKSKKI